MGAAQKRRRWHCDECAREEVSYEHLTAEEGEVGSEHRLVLFSVRPRHQQPVAPNDQDTVLTDVVPAARAWRLVLACVSLICRLYRLRLRRLLRRRLLLRPLLG